MLIPIGHEKTSVRRLPWVTFSVMGLCLITFLFTFPGEQSRMEHAFEDLGEAFEYFGEHPYLEMDQRLRNVLVQEYGHEQTTALIEMTRQAGDRDGAKVALKRELATHPENVDAAIAL